MAGTIWERNFLIIPSRASFAPLSAPSGNHISLTAPLSRIVVATWRPEVLGSNVAISRRNDPRSGDFLRAHPHLPCAIRCSDPRSSGTETSADWAAEGFAAVQGQRQRKGKRNTRAQSQAQGQGGSDGRRDGGGEVRAKGGSKGERGAVSARAQNRGEGEGESGVQWVEERGLRLQVQGSFYRSESAVGRDLATLVAWRDARARRAAEEQQSAVGQAEDRAGEARGGGARRGAEAEGRGMKERRRRGFRVLDVLSGSGVRGARYLSQGEATFVWCNDASVDTHAALVANLEAVSGVAAADAAADSSHAVATAPPPPPPPPAAAGPLDAGRGKQKAERKGEGEGDEEREEDEGEEDEGDRRWRKAREGKSGRETSRWRVTHEDGLRVLNSCYERRSFFDLVDVDAFGSDTRFIGPALAATAMGGLLYLTATDGFSSAGHAPFRALAAYGTYMRPLPFCNELGLRMLLGAAVREAATRKLTVSPVFSLYAPHGPVFRALVRVTAASPHQQWQGE
ncbi:hypothetical protein CLOM_g18592 [Closterium sp. NIES-68]|nr:hypothetical protein CLOM_g18592 [Closterium sp. NIES-68]